MNDEKNTDILEKNIGKKESSTAVITETDSVHHEHQHKKEHSHHDGHRHHSHHHGHHSRHHKNNKGTSSEKKAWKKIAAFFKKNRNIIFNVACCMAIVVLLIIIASDKDDDGYNDPNASVTEVTQSTVRIETAVFLEEVNITPNAITYYLDPSNTDNAHEVYGKFNGYATKLNYGLPWQFSYRVTALPANVAVESAILEISENMQFENTLKYNVDISDSRIDIYNLKVGTHYYYRLNLTLTGGKVIGTTGDFVTKNSVRVLNIDGIVNARDFGNWYVEGGKKIKQGLLFRGSELDGAVEPTYSLTPDGLNEMKNVLGIRFDLDLRSPSVNDGEVNALGDGVIHKYYDAPMYADAYSENNHKTIRKIFSDLASPENYPMYLHCTYGRDRTGTICYLLGALLGMSEQDLLKAYDLSAFTDSYSDYERYTELNVRTKMLEGDTLKEKVEGYLLSVGVTEEEIATIRQIYLTD